MPGLKGLAPWLEHMQKTQGRALTRLHECGMVYARVLALMAYVKKHALMANAQARALIKTEP